MTTIAVMPGDGIGPDIVDAAMLVAAAGAEACDESLDFEVLPVGLSALKSHGSTLPGTTVESLKGLPGWILGPVSHHLYPIEDDRYPNPSGALRTGFELFANVRPARSFCGVSPRPDIDFVVVRENTEGFYADRNLHTGRGEFMPTEDVALSLRVITRAASERIARYACGLATSRQRASKVTVVHKANVLRVGDGLFLDTCREVIREWPNLTMEDLHVDAAAFHLVRRPQEFDVIVTTNMFGDILSDEAAGLVGSLGLAPGLNVGPDHAMAQAAHGSAPDIAESRSGNPVAMILSTAQLLEWLASREHRPGLAAAADRMKAAVEGALGDGDALTPDLGGKASTEEMAQTVAKRATDGPDERP